MHLCKRSNLFRRCKRPRITIQMCARRAGREGTIVSAIRSHAGLILVIGFLSAESLAAPLARSEDADMTSQVTWSNNLNVKMVADLKLGSTDKICIKSAGDDPIKVAAHSQASDEIRYNNEDTVYPAPYKACRNLGVCQRSCRVASRALL